MRGTKIWAIIAVILLAGGIALAAVGTARGGTWNMEFDWNSFKIITDSSNYVTETKTVDKFDTLVLNTRTIDVNISYGDEWSVSYCVPESRKPEITSSNGKLTIDSNEKTGFSFFSFNTTKQKRYINITIPEKEAKKNFDIKTSTGDIEIKGIAFEGTIAASTGDIKIVECAMGDLEISLSTGDTRIENSTAGALKISASTGDVTLDKVNCDSFEAGTSTGDIKVNDSAAEKIKAAASTGDVTLNINGDRSEYSMECKTSTGSVKVDDEKMGKSYTKEDSGDCSIYAKTSTGDIKISFEN